MGLAECNGENPVLFDAHRYPEAWAALTICAKCRVTQECIEYVRPSKSHFDGVCGGVVWRNGYRVRLDNSTREDAITRNKILRGEMDETPGLSGLDGQ